MGSNKKEIGAYQCHQRMRRRQKDNRYFCRCVSPFKLADDKNTCLLDSRNDKIWAYNKFAQTVKEGSAKKYKMECPPNALHIARLCYVQGPAKMTKMNADNYCMQYKGRLA